MRTHKKSPDAPLPLQQTRQAGRMPVASLHETTGMIPAAPGRSGAQPLTRLPRQIPLPDGSLEATQRRPQ
ncbi:MAG TPA: hypothetical protein H9736_05895 [Candidatus Anaerotruncus excrementipullorum]|uniref:Uncharacterized protein n=1 Tax=Candidatus Anaerotruncus excrementipullorum TaxID=2838465 RepID=A0A9D1WRK3_9FIRM|nr:hypothetical protein [Candidatus Anaerotruncus excrementipullorum]